MFSENPDVWKAVLKLIEESGPDSVAYGGAIADEIAWLDSAFSEDFFIALSCEPVGSRGKAEVVVESLMGRVIALEVRLQNIMLGIASWLDHNPDDVTLRGHFRKYRSLLTGVMSKRIALQLHRYPTEVLHNFNSDEYFVKKSECAISGPESDRLREKARQTRKENQKWAEEAGPRLIAMLDAWIAHAEKRRADRA